MAERGSVFADCKVDVFCTHNFLEQFFCNKGENRLHNFEILQHLKILPDYQGDILVQRLPHQAASVK